MASAANKDHHRAAVAFFNHIKAVYNLPSDQALADLIGCGHQTIADIRKAKFGITASIVLGVFDLGDWDIPYIRKLAGLPDTERKGGTLSKE